MKKWLIVLLYIILYKSSYAQIFEGTPVYFCSVNNDIYNPGTHNNVSYNDMWVVIRNDRDWSFEEKIFINRSFGDNHPGHIILDEATVTYNCHGYTFGIIQGSNRYNISWSEDLCYNAYSLVSIPQKGDIAVLRYNNNQPDSPHSAIVYSSDTLISKWGDLPLTKHHKDSLIILSNEYAAGQVYYTYYRRVINNDIQGPSVFNGTGTYTFDHDVAPTSCTWSVEPAAMFQTASGSGYTANLSYATPLAYLAPKATITFTFQYGCDNHYTATKEIDLHIPTTTIAGTATSEGFIVDTNAIVTITGTVNSNTQAKTIVPVGTKLIIDGGTMTGNTMWQGIEVWGDSNADQQSHHGTYYQGYLEMKNGATIENAVCAVELWHPNYWGTTGGIIHATDAIFRNNAKAVHALNYVDHNLNGNEIAYNSQFTKCSFIIDEDYLGTETFFKHVDLANVNSVYFSGCDFSVEPKADGVSPSCMGIGAYGAGFLVKSYCEEPNMHPSCPESDIVRCTFEGFNNGILSINENSQARSFTVRDASFIKNNRGVFIQNTGYATIVRSDFQIGGNSSCGYGIYADGVTGFRIEENSFSPSQGVQCPTYGIGIFNSQGVNDVYLNTFDGLTCANVAYGVNHIADVSGRPPATIPGLTYSCNDNTGNGIDFCVLKDNGTGGIASPQGSATVPAGNTFSGSNYHFYNGGDYEVKYFCKLTGANEIPDPTKMQYVDSDTITCSNDCASHYGNGGVVRSTEEKAALAAIYQSSGDAHERMTAAGDIIRSCLNEDAIDAAVLRQWLGNMHEPASDRMAVASYIQEGDFTSALALAGSLPSTYNLQGDDLSDHNDYMTLLGLYQTLHNSNRTVHEMTSSETDMVKDMAENGLGASQQMARAMLMTINDRYIEPYICPDMPRNPDRGTTSGNANPTANVSELSVIVAPIPATTWVSVDYKLPCDTGSATMSVFNSLGVKVKEVELNGSQGTKTLDLHGMPDGVYSYIVRCGEYQNTGKLIITL